jgi:hypothetical protein
VAARFEIKAEDSAAFVGGAILADDAGEVTGLCCVSVVAYDPVVPFSSRREEGMSST